MNPWFASGCTIQSKSLNVYGKRISIGLPNEKTDGNETI